MTITQWTAIKNHDKAFDGTFYYAVKNSRSLCRPSCTARTCEPVNIIIFDTLEEGLAAGYHPCSRCRPDLPVWRGAKRELTERAKNYIQEHFRDKFSLEVMARALYIDKIYLAKSFKEITGQTLLKYHNQTRCDEAARLLAETELSIESIGNQVGFATPSHFSRIFKSCYNQRPSEYRKNYLNSLK